MARKSPICISFLRMSSGNRPAKIEIKIILSIPKTISKKVSVKKAIIKSGVNMVYFIFLIVPRCLFLLSPTREY